MFLYVICGVTTEWMRHFLVKPTVSSYIIKHKENLYNRKN